MRFLLLSLFVALCAATLSGCVFERSGSQDIVIDPGYIRPAHAKSNQAMWEASGDPYWRGAR